MVAEPVEAPGRNEISEQRRMTVIELRENPLHRSLAEQRRAFLDTETVAVLLYSGHFFIIQIDDLPMDTPERSLPLLDVLRIGSR